MVKIFFGNLPDNNVVTNEVIRPLFEEHGTVTECEVIKNYGFCHMESLEEAQNAIKALHGFELQGRKLRVEMSDAKNSKKPSFKVFVGNLPNNTQSETLRSLFEAHVEVLEADVMPGKNFGFVHLDSSIGKVKASEIIRTLNGYDLEGSKLRVQASTTDVRTKPGMGGSGCFKCGGGGHWSKECPMQYSGDGGGRGGYGGRGSYGGMGWRGGGPMTRGGGRSGGRYGDARASPYQVYPSVIGYPQQAVGGQTDYREFGDFSDDHQEFPRSRGRGRGGSGGGPMRDRGGYGGEYMYGGMGGGGGYGGPMGGSG